MSPHFTYQPLFDLLESTPLKPWLDTLPQRCRDGSLGANNGHLPQWLDALDQLPQAVPSRVDFEHDAVTFGRASDLEADAAAVLERSLQAFHPWRKGPWNYFGIDVDSEWRSCLKWSRIQDALTPLDDRLVLDIGSGNGYYGWRMAAQRPRLVLGADPFLLYVMQHQIARRYAPTEIPVHVVPCGIETLPPALPAFDTVLSMGVLYHRRDPVAHLRELLEHLQPGGELVVESIVVDGPAGHCLHPSGRYAKMRNVHALPSVLTLERWLAEAGGADIRLADTSPTTTAEQRSTDWMRFESLADFLDPADPSKTVEGHPAPKRAVFVARKP